MAANGCLCVRRQRRHGVGETPRWWFFVGREAMQLNMDHGPWPVARGLGPLLVREHKVGTVRYGHCVLVRRRVVGRLEGLAVILRVETRIVGAHAWS